MALKHFSTKQIIFLAIIGALLFVMDFFVSGISTIVGVPFVGGLINTLFFVGLATIGGLIVRRFGAYTLMAFIYGVLAIPNNTFGPPGVYKIIIVLFLGLVADIIIFAFGYRVIGYYFSLTIANVLGIPVGLFTFRYLNFPGADELAKIIWLLMIIYAVESIIGAWVGIKLYEKKISKMNVVRQISG